MKKRRCWTCNRLFIPYGKQVYCGSQKSKSGCAYKRWLMQVYGWSSKPENKNKLRAIWRKATNKYRQT